MRYGNQTLRAVEERYSRMRKAAKAKADRLNAILDDDENYLKAYNAANSARFEISKAKFNGDEKSLLKAETDLSSANEVLNNIMAEHGITPKDLVPDYSCRKCNDTGFDGEKRCQCFYRIVSEVVTEELGIRKKTFPNFESSVYKGASNEKVYLKMMRYCDKADEVKKSVVLLGKVGSGKTHLAGCIADCFEKKGKTVIFITSYELHSVFAGASSLYDNERESYISALTDCDLLVIDDLGSELSFKNVSGNCLYSIISERSDKDLPLVITTNLSVDEIYNVYGERIGSRIFNKNKSIIIELPEIDFRRK